jgi:hypothetical protein
MAGMPARSRSAVRSVPLLFSLKACWPTLLACILQISDNCTGLLHESEQRGDSQLNEGDQVEVVVLSVRGDKVALSQRSAEEVNQVSVAIGWCAQGRPCQAGVRRPCARGAAVCCAGHVAACACARLKGISVPEDVLLCTGLMCF